MFIAIKGEKYDGHSFIGESIQNGAKYIIINNEMKNDIDSMNYTGITIICVEDTRRSLPYIIDNLFSHPSHNFKLIGVTGTNGIKDRCFECNIFPCNTIIFFLHMF